MKKTTLLTITVSIFMLLGLMLTGCQDPIFEAIREDVPPEDATVSGNIRAITRYTAGSNEYLVLAANDGVRYKLKDDNGHGKWGTYKAPFSLIHYSYESSDHSGEEILTILADSTYLYIISAEYSHTAIEGISYPDSINIWAKAITSEGTKWSEEGEWTAAPNKIGDFDLFPLYEKTTSGTDFHYSNFRVFQTNSPKKEHRAAFIRTYDSENKIYKYFKLNGSSEPVECTADVEAAIIDPNPSSDADYKPTALSVVYFNGFKFITSPAATTNETYTDDATYFYYSNGDSKLIYNDGNTATVAFDSKKLISCLATTTDSILIGHGKTSSDSPAVGGINRADLTNGVPASELGSFRNDSNAKFQITSDNLVLAMLNANPEKTEEESALYVSISFSGYSNNFDNIGLWSYYPERGNWNRE
jgi:hypothetical protein